jgi:hypothetical protein
MLSMMRAVLMAVFPGALAALVSAQSPAPAASPNPAPATPAPPAFTRAAAADPRRGQALLDRALAAHGGAPAIDAVERLEFRGNSVRILPGQDPVTMPSITYFVIPDLYRHQLTTQAGVVSSLINREGAFVVLGAGALPLPAPEAAALRATSRRNLMALFRGRKAKDFHASWVGTGKAGDTPLEMVEIEAGGEKTVLGIDPGTGLVRQSIYSMPLNGKPVQVVATLSDVRPLSNGVKYPFASQGTVDGQPAFGSKLDTIVVNGTIDPALFVPPAPPAQEQPFPGNEPASGGPFSGLPAPAAAPSPSPSPR